MMHKYSRFIHSLLFACLLLPLQVIAVTAEAPRDPAKFFFNTTFGDFSEELKNAKAQGKKGVLLFFEMDECPYCHYMKQKVLNQPAVQKYYRDNFLIFRVDIEGDIEITTFKGEVMKEKEFAFKLNRVRATPVFAFYDLSGERIARHTGKTSSIDEFLLLGKYVADGEYKNMQFSNYKKQQPVK